MSHAPLSAREKTLSTIVPAPYHARLTATSGFRGLARNQNASAVISPPATNGSNNPRPCLNRYTASDSDGGPESVPLDPYITKPTGK